MSVEALATELSADPESAPDAIAAASEPEPSPAADEPSAADPAEPADTDGDAAQANAVPAKPGSKPADATSATAAPAKPTRQSSDTTAATATATQGASAAKAATEAEPTDSAAEGTATAKAARAKQAGSAARTKPADSAADTGAAAAAQSAAAAKAARAKQAGSVAGAKPADSAADTGATAAAQSAAAAKAAEAKQAGSAARTKPVESASDAATAAANGNAAAAKAAEVKPVDSAASQRAAKPAAEAKPVDSAAEAAAEGASAGASVAAPARHSGDRIARRYRLEECTTSNEVFSSWRAVDEKLRRAVGIHLLAAAHPRAKGVLAAARQAALLGDPRFVQVLDAVEDGDEVYVVREWLPDATGLDTLLLAEPLEAYEAYQLVRQLADALAAAHRRGLAHLRLTPASVLRTDSGQYRIDGIAVNAALRGVEADDRSDAALRDTRAIGALLFAALTHRWPFPEGGNGLQRLPRDLGTVPAERVRAGVHRGLSDLTARTLCTPPGGKLTPITAPDELAKAVTELPKVRQPEPEPLVLPSYPAHRATPQRGTGAAPTTVTASVPPRTPHQPHRPQQAPQPALPGRSGRALKWAVSLVVLGAIALGSWGTAEALMAKNNSNNGATNNQLGQNTTGSTPGTSGDNGRTLKTLSLSSATEFSPLDPTTIAGDKAPLTIDGDPKTAWITASYSGYPNFGNYTTRKDGSGILVDLGSVQSVSEVKVLLPFGEQTQEILAAPAGDSSAPTDLSGFTQRISNDQLLPGTSLDSGVLAQPVRTRYVLIHVTSLPADPTSAGQFRGGISEIQVLG
ncbi:hypothetical protein ABH931_000283 [Streptacidiphilus sp. MAP12-33]|uniref:protein kinase family protein n=1 Tax=Streptacidiphilus sp. MAP12-33 TaxID=3156266 RepID=UPI003514C65D